MNAKELQNYLSKNPVERGILSYNELDEVILTIYNIISWSLRDECDSITVLNTQVVWHKSGKIYGQLDTPFNFKSTFEKIRNLDRVIQSHLKPVSEREGKIQYVLVITK